LAVKEGIQAGGRPPRKVGKAEKQVISQSNEDDIIWDIFQDIGEGDRRFLEIGCGDGTQNNTMQLLLAGWSGVWVDSRRKRVNCAREIWADYPVTIINRMVTPDNVYKFFHEPIDFLSIDIDGNDYHVWDAITAKPRVVCIEYSLRTISKGNELRLDLFNDLAKSKGYRFHAVSASKVNAFYIHES
jgi:hypothetical protein